MSRRGGFESGVRTRFALAARTPQQRRAEPIPRRSRAGRRLRLEEADRTVRSRSACDGGASRTFTRTRFDGAAERYLAFLKAGGSLYPLDALQQAGVDLATPAPVEHTFGVLARLVDRLEQALAQRQ